MTPRSEPTRLPADRGLVCLGLLMQLAGDVFAAYGLLTAFSALFALRDQPGDGLWVFIVLATGAGRSLAHRAAGVQLVYGGRTVGVPGPVDHVAPDERRLGGIHRYLACAALHTALVALIIDAHFNAPPATVLAVIAALLVWPAVLAVIVSRPAIRELGRRLPLVADKGFEAVAIVMTALACAGLGLAVIAVVALFDQPAATLSHGPTLVLIVLACGLVVRAGLHLRAGLAGLRETSLERAVAYATRYADFAVISALCSGGAMLLFVTVADFDLGGVAILAGGVWMLLAWPLSLRRFFRDRHFDDLLAEAPGAHHRAPDAGLTGLGWLLAGNAAIALTWLLLRVAAADRPSLAGALAVLEAPGDRDLAWQLFVIAVGGWAAGELVCMTPRARGAALAWVLASSGIAVYLLRPELEVPDFAFERLAGRIWLGGQLVLAGVTVALVMRRVEPAARARYRVPRSTMGA